jgi:hypothetical protein
MDALGNASMRRQRFTNSIHFIDEDTEEAAKMRIDVPRL